MERFDGTIGIGNSLNCKISDVACTLCGTVCDDLEITVDDQRVIACSPPCELAEPWWLAQHSFDEPLTMIRGQLVSHDAAIEQAAELLRESTSPLAQD